jgi:GAF domain-containing protein
MRPDRLRENYAKLRRIVGDLRSGLISTTISLSLMNIISESVERAVLFLVRHAELVALGAFGAGRGGEPLADLTRGLRLPIDGTNAVADSLGDGQVRSMPFEKARFPDSFKNLLGRPRTGECAIFPVLGGQKVIAVVYADNGFSNTAIEQVEILELAAVQAGLALENELLRRQMGQNRPDPPPVGH